MHTLTKLIWNICLLACHVTVNWHQRTCKCVVHYWNMNFKILKYIYIYIYWSKGFSWWRSFLLLSFHNEPVMTHSWSQAIKNETPKTKIFVGLRVFMIDWHFTKMARIYTYLESVLYCIVTACNIIAVTLQFWTNAHYLLTINNDFCLSKLPICCWLIISKEVVKVRIKGSKILSCRIRYYYFLSTNKYDMHITSEKWSLN